MSSDNSDMSIEADGKDYTESRYPENILCRDCGSDVSSANFVISKLSPSTYYAINDTLFNREKVLVQVVSHDFIFQFPVITFNQSTCQGFGEVDNSWFPGYRWKVCICPDCGAFLGWVFEAIYPGRVKSPDAVFCLVLTSVIGESCNYILNQEGFCGNWFCLWRIGSLLCMVGSRTCPICLFYSQLQILWSNFLPNYRTMASSDNLSDQDKEFLASCEEQLKDRYTENDAEYMKVFQAEPSLPPILESWWVPNNGGRRNDRRFNRRSQPYSRDGHEGSSRGRHHSRGHDDRPYQHRSNRPRYY